MLRSVKDLEEYTVCASDGEVGSVANFLVDDERWTIRYLVAQADGFFDNRRLLISPISFRRADWSTRHFHVALTRAKVKGSPNVDTDKPVSRQHEADHFGYYGYPPYWGDSGMWAMGMYPGTPAHGIWKAVPAEPSEPGGDVHLRSFQELCGYHIQGTDGAIGHVEDFIVDDETWEVRYLVVNTSNWWLGKKVLIAPHWAQRVSWEERKVFLDLSRQKIKASPEWNAADPINRAFEMRLYDYYGRPAYWVAMEGGASVPRASGGDPR